MNVSLADISALVEARENYVCVYNVAAIAVHRTESLTFRYVDVECLPSTNAKRVAESMVASNPPGMTA